jgi:CheY-like chemotaxis protein
MVMDRLKNFPALEGIPIIVVTAGTSPATRERAMAAGAFAFVEKPFKAETLLATIESALGPRSRSLN